MASTTTHIHINTEVFMCLFPGKSFLQPLLYLSSKKKLSISTMWFQCYVSVLYLWKHILFYYYTSTFHTQTHRHILFHYIIDTTTFDTPKAIAAQHTTHHNHFMWSSPLSFSFSLCHLPTSTLQQPIVQSSFSLFLYFSWYHLLHHQWEQPNLLYIFFIGFK